MHLQITLFTELVLHSWSLGGSSGKGTQTEYIVI